MVRRKIKFLTLSLTGLLFVVELVLAAFLFRVPGDGLGMRVIFCKVINTSSDACFQSLDTGTIEGVKSEGLPRLQAELRAVVSSSNDDLPSAIAVMEWVRSRLVPGKPTQPVTGDLAIIDKALTDKHLAAWCDEFAKLYYLCCRAVGLRCRIIHLSGHADELGTLQAHYLDEVWDRQEGCWFAVDPYFGRYFEIAGKNPSVLDVHRAVDASQVAVLQLSEASPPLELDSYLAGFAYLQAVAGPVFASGRELLLSGKRVVFYNWVDKSSPPMRQGYEAAFLSGRLIMPGLIVISIAAFLVACAASRKMPSAPV